MPKHPVPPPPAPPFADAPPILMVVVDTEESFDWTRPVDRESTSVRAMAEVARGQSICEAFGIRPVYVVDYPVAAQKAGWGPLRPIIESGRGVIGAHTHPWVTPPHLEPVNARNSFPGNLPAELEAAKLDRLTAVIEENFAVTPRIHKAGRYGFGPNTAAILEARGYLVDLSPSPPFDFSSEGGPDHSRHGNLPTWPGEPRHLLCLPTTGAHAGHWPGDHQRLHRFSHHPFWQRLRLPGILSRLDLSTRIRLSPEGFTIDDLKKLTRFLLARGVRIFSFSFHSPSLQPGNTPYVRDVADLQAFLQRFRDYFRFFLDDLGGVPGTPLEIRDRLLKNSPGDP